MNEITQDLVRKLFDYRDDNLYWKVRKAYNTKIGDIAGYVRPDGYRSIQINSKMHLAHRLVFLYHHGYLPEFLDHIDGNRSNNDISNLREATGSQNQANRKNNKSINGKPTSSGFKGVYWNKQREKWTAHITINSKEKNLGYFDSEIDAALASDKALIKRDGEFAKTNAMMFPKTFKVFNQ